MFVKKLKFSHKWPQINKFDAMHKFEKKSVKWLTFGYRALKDFFFIPYFEIYIKRTRYVNV